MNGENACILNCFFGEKTLRNILFVLKLFVLLHRF